MLDSIDKAQTRIACLDDEAQVLLLLENALSDYQVRPFSSYEAFMDDLVGSSPQCILLDVDISRTDISGYDVCRQLRQNTATQYTPIIFVSGKDELDSRLEGYSAGADDFVCKPFDIDELQAKVSRAVVHQAYNSGLESAVDNARQTAFEAMTHSAEQGEITRFIEQAGSCSHAQPLLELLVSTLKNFGLNSVVADWSKHSATFASHQPEVRPLEAELLQNCRYGRRIIEMERRMVVNFDQVSVLIKNTPWQEPERYGRVKDHLCVLLSAMNERLVALQKEKKLHQQTLLLQVVGELRDSLNSLQQQQEGRWQEAGQTVDDLELELKEEVTLLNLDADQERHLQALVRGHVEKLSHCYRNACDVQEELQPVLSGLEQVVNAC